MAGLADSFEIARWASLPSPGAVVPALEAIMIEAGGRAFPPGHERNAFVERWLGRFLAHDPRCVLLLVRRTAGAHLRPTEPADIAGYLVGATDDPSKAARFADLPYFQTFAAQCARFPAHLHINLSPAVRSAGHGQRLIEAFATIVRDEGAAGMHVVTSAAACNVRFYARCAFAEVGRTSWNGREIVMLGRTL